MRYFFVLLIIVQLLIIRCKSVDKADYPIKPVPFNHVHVNDAFWLPKINTNIQTSIPTAFEKCRETGRFDNFALAGGLITGEHKGDFPFDDTDVYKILEGASYALAVNYDNELDNYLDSIINLISVAQEPDGYLFTCRTNKCNRLHRWMGDQRWERINSHELYNIGHLIEAAVAHNQATGKKTLLNIAIKAADRVYADFGPNPGQKQQPGGHPIIEMALVKLYRATNNINYLNLAQYFVDETGRGSDGHELNPYSQDHMPIVDQTEAVGHAVRFGYLYSGVTDLAAITNNQGYKNACKNVWENVVGKKLYITGGIGSTGMGEGFTHNYHLPNMTAYCETCAAISNVYWNYRMFLQNGHAKYFDVLEKVLYNGVISGVSADGKHYFYDNPLESDGSHQRQEWFGCACCPGNITRFMPSVPGYIYANTENDIFVNLFVQSKASVNIDGSEINIEQITNYPWNGNVTVNVNTDASLKFNIKIRIPGWAINQAVPSNLYSFAGFNTVKPVIMVNNIKTDYKIVDGYAVIKKNWQGNNQIQVSFDMPVRKVLSNQEVKENNGKFALQRGPLVYCAEGADQMGHKILSSWVPDTATFKTYWADTLLNGVQVIKTTAVEKLDNNNNTYTLTAIPYYLWNNRGKNQMQVWLAASNQAVVNQQVNKIANMANFSVSRIGHSYGTADGYVPMSSGDISYPYFYWYAPQGNSVEWLQYEFDHEQKVSSTSLYYLVLNHYEQNFALPQWAKVYYKNGSNWNEVTYTSSVSIEKDKFNKISFNPVITTGLKVEIMLQPGFSAGVHEWWVN